MSLVDDIDRRLHVLVDQLTRLVGPDILDLIPPSRIWSAAETLAAGLCSDDHRQAAQTAIDCAELVDLDDPADARTPLGLAVATTFGHDTVGATDAARLLGISRGRVYQLLDTGKLDRCGDGITRASIARRLAT